MQSGIETSRARIAAFNETGGVTRVDSHPDKKSGFFGKDGFSFDDVLDVVNPLNHIPVVSEIVRAETGSTISAASRIIGGTLLGGPVGLVASLANIIFEGATGSTPIQAVYAALTGEAADTATMVASNDTKPELEEIAQVATEDSEEVQVAQAAPVEKIQTQEITQLAALTPAAVMPVAGSQAVLDLYGNSNTSAHNSYKKAQLLPYLRDVTTSKIL